MKLNDKPIQMLINTINGLPCLFWVVL